MSETGAGTGPWGWKKQTPPSPSCELSPAAALSHAGPHSTPPRLVCALENTKSRFFLLCSLVPCPCHAAAGGGGAPQRLLRGHPGAGPRRDGRGAAATSQPRTPGGFLTAFTRPLLEKPLFRGETNKNNNHRRTRRQENGLQLCTDKGQREHEAGQLLGLRAGSWAHNLGPCPRTRG